MKFTLHIAWRYIFSKKSTNAIHVISFISMLGIVIGSAALIVVLSAFNGFESVVLKLYGSFYPDITITAHQGKVFSVDSAQFKLLTQIEGIEFIAQSLEENALLAYDKQEHIATLKGVDTMFKYVTSIDDSVFIGDYILSKSYGAIPINCGVLGSGVAAVLNVALGFDYPPIQIFMPRRGTQSSLNPRSAFIQKSIQPVGVFRLQQEFDSKYIFTSLQFMRSLLEYENNEISAYEIKVKNGYSIEAVMKTISLTMGAEFDIKNRFMQNEFLYKVMRNERWVVYLILTFILIIATFNMVGSISMLVIDKQKDIGILKTLGATEKRIRSIFFIQGLMQTLVSIFIGFFIATLLCVVQIQYGLISIPGSGSFVVTAYPIALKWKDYITIFFTILIIGGIASYIPAYLASSQQWLFKKQDQ